MCDCWQCNMTEEQQDAWADEYLEWEYQQYLKSLTESIEPLSMDEWLETIRVD
ncbi:hypothetical protein [Domibacillus aminovorans]|uniref:hypothetical protein n=1 Tax=Domibacillus aminovorans TaxID=29332 RepID=UPI0012FE3B09|nr:hypothetical protein [Domibacillus aminovorans]